MVKASDVEAHATCPILSYAQALDVQFLAKVLLFHALFEIAMGKPFKKSSHLEKSLVFSFGGHFSVDILFGHSSGGQQGNKYV